MDDVLSTFSGRDMENPRAEPWGDSKRAHGDRGYERIRINKVGLRPTLQNKAAGAMNIARRGFFIFNYDQIRIVYSRTPPLAPRP